MKLRIIFWIFLFFLSSSALSAKENVVLQLRWDHQFQFAGYYAAKWQGYYDKAGLHVDIKTALIEGKILSAIEEVSEGRAQFGIGAADILKARDEGKPLVIIASIFQNSAAGFYTREDTRIESPADFLELKVARRVNDLIDIEFQAMLKAEGIDPTLVKPYPHQPGMDHLMTGKVDVAPGYSINIPFTAESKGYLIREFRPVEYGIDFYGDSIFTHQKIITKNPDLVTKFKKASLKGWEYALNNPEPMAVRISKELHRVRTVEDLMKFNKYQSLGIIKLTHYPVVQVGNINPARWQRMNQYLMSIGLVKNPVNLEDLIFDHERLDRMKYQKRQKIFLTVGTLLFTVTMLVFLWVRLLRQTVKKQTESLMLSSKRIRESEERFQFAMKAAQDGLYDWNLVTNEIYYSPAWKSMLGYEDHELPNDFSVWEQLTAPEDVKRALRMQNDMIDKKRDRFEMEFKMKHKDGHWVDILSRANAIFDENNQPVRIVGTHVNITERKRIEEQLLTERDNLYNIFNSMEDGVYITNSNHEIQFVNHVLIQEFGSYEGKKCFEYFHDREESCPWCKNKEVLNGRTIRWEWYSSKNKKTYDLIDTPIKMPDGSISKLEIFRDITEKQEFLKQLKEKEAALRLSLDAAHAGTWLWNITTGEVIWDDQMQRIFGLEPGTFDGTFEAWKSRVHPDDVEEAEKATMDALKNDKGYEFDYRVKGSSGEWRVVNAQAATLRDDSGKPIRMYGFAMDISERKNAEETLKNTLKEKEVLLRELYHRTKNNMQVISAFIDLQAETINDDVLLKVFQETQNRITTMSLVHEKLYQAKDLSKINLMDYFLDLVNLIRASYKGLSEGVKLIPEMEEVDVTIDSAIPCGLIMNELISNAFKHAFTDSERGEIHIILKKNENNQIEFSVKDNGVGLPTGLDIKMAQTLGLQSIVALTEHQLQGSVKVLQNQGTQFIITFSEKLVEGRI